MTIKFPCRLDKFLSHFAEVPRSKAKIGIKRKHATINGEVIIKADTQVTPDDAVTWYGEEITAVGERYYMLNKPEDFICANSDEMHQTVFDLLDEPMMDKLHVAGRLDIDTTGLVLITSDGDWSHKITSPRHQKYKVYLIETEQPITDEMCEQLTNGVMLHGEKSATKPAVVERLADYSMRLSIYEGKYHQVKRMLAAVDNRVVALHREKIGTVALDPNLAPGEYRPLTQHEIETISS
ncbi:Ribosomal small subunit pseudouridine synthase A [Pseudoalteromonas sp. P1-9]|nr:Ribosomal small subunit pseudouridine synthase A [Pseudoalteromonas sp. P1-9]